MGASRQPPAALVCRVVVINLTIPVEHHPLPRWAGDALDVVEVVEVDVGVDLPAVHRVLLAGDRVLLEPRRSRILLPRQVDFASVHEAEKVAECVLEGHFISLSRATNAPKSSIPSSAGLSPPRWRVTRHSFLGAM